MVDRRRHPLPGDFEDFERTLHGRMMEVEREMLAEELAKGDLNEEAVVIEGMMCRRVLRCAQTYQTVAGPVQVERTLYKDRTDPHMPSLVSLDARVGIVEGRCTPLADKQATWARSRFRYTEKPPTALLGSADFTYYSLH